MWKVLEGYRGGAATGDFKVITIILFTFGKKKHICKTIMSRSYKKPIEHNHPKSHKQTFGYWKRVRKNINQIVSRFRRTYKNPDAPLELALPEPRAIVSEYKEKISVYNDKEHTRK